MTKVIDINERRGTVQPLYRHKRFQRPDIVPAMRLQGKWLAEIAKPGQKYRVIPFPEIGALYIKFIADEKEASND